MKRSVLIIWGVLIVAIRRCLDDSVIEPYDIRGSYIIILVSVFIALPPPACC